MISAASWSWGVVLFVLCIIHALYTLWILGTPFIDADQPILEYIPDKYYAVGVPLLSACAVGSTVIITLGVFLVVSK
jgi:hypothetical protein